MKIHQPIIDFLVSGHPAQSTSLYAWSLIDESTRKNKPQFRVPMRYLMIHCTTERWKCRGACMNLLTVCTSKEIYERVIVT